MNSDMTIVMGPDESQEQFVQVPIKKKDFGDFITSLLGQPETIRDRKIGVYEATYEWIVHLHHLLDQRIKQQAQSSLVDFSATFIYRNAPERKITSLEGFLNFNEAKIVTTKGIKITWTYLVYFPNKPTPEKQEISLTLLTDKTEVVHIGNTNVSRQTTNKHGLIAYAISHTERTWGDDIQSLLNKEIDSLFENEKWYEKLLDKAVIFIALGMFVAGFIVPDYIEQLIREKETAQIFLKFVPEEIEMSDLSTDDKLTLALHLLDPNNQLHKIDGWYRGISFIGGIFLAIFTIMSFDREKPSYLIVTNEDKKKIKKCKSADNSTLFKKIFSFVLAVGAGVAGNYAYYFMSL
ncbi:hypothetical protein Q4490_04415 [Neptunomonas phycophila]|uniref:Uncharacterized protein n=1 Tax=Neptunomonas phycophila TaxID=1572645 RepID=A0AAW7XED9_9GAMM|nr:hypothetical protein [Neptunomonas phycophila]MDO6452801.1 hypothetical protein [Neptunomonas phycophila]